MTRFTPIIPILLAAALAAALASPAGAAPAGDEYLPGQPKATGESGSDSAGAVASGATTGTEDDAVGGAAGGEDKGGGGKGGEDAASINSTTSAADTSDSDGSGGLVDTLMDPVVLFLIAGVAAVAVGMTLRHRQGLTEEGTEKRVPRDPATAPHTPEGEILGGGGERRSS